MYNISFFIRKADWESRIKIATNEKIVAKQVCYYLL